MSTSTPPAGRREMMRFLSRRHARQVCAAALVVWVGAELPMAGHAQADYQLLHKFSGGANNGYIPGAGLTRSGGVLYGTTQFGGDSGFGVVYKLNANGTGFELLHEFAGGANDGTAPQAPLTLAGAKLYGTTVQGGDANRGTVFRVNVDGSMFGLLHEFAGGASDGAGPTAGLALVGSTLYGTTGSGGDNDGGTVYKLEVGGTGFQLLHEFTGGAGGGRTPSGELTVVGSTLYGTTFNGGAADRGTVFKVNIDGTGFGVLHEFAGGANDGSGPAAGLTLVGSTLYGTTSNGGDASLGTVFKIDVGGAGFQLLHEFAGGANDGSTPRGALTRVGDALFGTTTYGGATGGGTIYRINLDGTGFELLKDFAGTSQQGFNPVGGLEFDGSRLFGATAFGTDATGGSVFSVGPIGIPGDFSHSNGVGREDLLIWNGAYGPGSGADADGDGDSDGHDFLIWQRHLGQGAALAASVGVAEPGAAALGILAAALAMAIPRRRRR